jgi:hypothetical protein
MTAPERCPRCDRAECQRETTYEAWIDGPRDKNSATAGMHRFDVARRDCDAHAVNWRARCLAAEQRADDLRADGNQLRDRLVKAFARIDRLMEDAPHAD